MPRPQELRACGATPASQTGQISASDESWMRHSAREWSGSSFWRRRPPASRGRSRTKSFLPSCETGARSRVTRHPRIAQRKLFDLFTCEYCVSHYVAAAVLWIVGCRLLLPDWRGTLLAWLALVWIANVYMSSFGRLRLDIKRERIETEAEARQATGDAVPAVRRRVPQ